MNLFMKFLAMSLKLFQKFFYEFLSYSIYTGLKNKALLDLLNNSSGISQHFQNSERMPLYISNPFLYIFPCICPLPRSCKSCLNICSMNFSYNFSEISTQLRQITRNLKRMHLLWALLFKLIISHVLVEDDKLVSL